MNERNLNELISDEALRKRIRELLPSPERRTSWSDRLKHPLIMLVAGFLLTWGVGTVLTGRWNEEKRQRELAIAREQAAFDAAIDAAQRLASIVDTHHGAALILIREVGANAPIRDGQITAARNRYDDAHAQWLGWQYAGLYTIRNAVSDAGYSPLDALVEQDYSNLVARFDSLMRQYAARPSVNRPPEPEYTAMQACGRAIVSELFKLIAARQTVNHVPGVSEDEIATIRIDCKHADDAGSTT